MEVRLKKNKPSIDIFEIKVVLGILVFLCTMWLLETHFIYLNLQAKPQSYLAGPYVRPHDLL